LPKIIKRRKPASKCPRHNFPCTCAMGHLYRFVEPVLLLVLKEKGSSYGYDLLGSLAEHAFTDGEIEKAVLYRTLRRLEHNGYIVSNWDTGTSGPARRVYSLTKDGEKHLGEWALVLGKVASSMNRFVRKVSSESPIVKARASY
jgi:PadR family transcriptional regulator, regulatory protein PadR